MMERLDFEEVAGLVLAYPKSPTGYARIIAYDPDGMLRRAFNTDKWIYRLVSYDPKDCKVTSGLGQGYFHGHELDSLVSEAIESRRVRR